MLIRRWERQYQDRVHRENSARDEFLQQMPAELQREAFFQYTFPSNDISAEAVSQGTDPSRIDQDTNEVFDAQHGPPVMNPEDPWNFGQDMVERFPALKARNFYCIQQHHATSKHFDIRFQCSEAHPMNALCEVCGGIVHRTDPSSSRPRCPGTISFAVPRGISDMKPGDGPRLAVETELHSIHYSVAEGGGIGSTLLYDIGTYEVINTSTHKDRAPDTQEAQEQEEHVDIKGIYGGRLGLGHEQALAKAYKGDKDSSAFSVELKGVRYHIQLTFMLPKKEAANQVFVKQKWHGRQCLRKKWLLQLAKPPHSQAERLNKEDKSLGDRSILSGLTMRQLQAGQSSSTNLKLKEIDATRDDMRLSVHKDECESGFEEEFGLDKESLIKMVQNSRADKARKQMKRKWKEVQLLLDDSETV